jgi:hypothetical protein
VRGAEREGLREGSSSSAAAAVVDDTVVGTVVADTAAAVGIGTAVGSRAAAFAWGSSLASERNLPSLAAACVEARSVAVARVAEKGDEVVWERKDPARQLYPACRAQDQQWSPHQHHPRQPLARLLLRRVRRSDWVLASAEGAA